MARCSTCHTLIDPGDGSQTCPECQQEYHQVCWNDMGGCATYGCKQAPAAEKAPPPVLVGQGWGDLKTCPSCRSSISSSLLLCRCGARFPYADPMSELEYGEWREKEESLKTHKRVIVVLFVLSLFGITAPLTGPIAAGYAWSKRKLLAGAHGTYLALAAGSAGLGLCYGMILILLAVGR